MLMILSCYFESLTRRMFTKGLYIIANTLLITPALSDRNIRGLIGIEGFLLSRLFYM